MITFHHNKAYYRYKPCFTISFVPSRWLLSTTTRLTTSCSVLSLSTDTLVDDYFPPQQGLLPFKNRYWKNFLNIVDDYFPPQQGLLPIELGGFRIAVLSCRWLLSTTTRLTTQTVTFFGQLSNICRWLLSTTTRLTTCLKSVSTRLVFFCRWLLSTTTRLTTYSFNSSQILGWIVDDYFPPQQGLLHWPLQETL